MIGREDTRAELSQSSWVTDKDFYSHNNGMDIVLGAMVCETI